MTQKTAIKNIIFPIEFDHFTGGMIHSVMTLARSLKNDYNVYIIAYNEAEVFKIDSDINPLELQKPWSISISTPFSTFGTYLEVRKLVKHFKKSETIVFTNNVGSELIFSGFGFFPIDLKRVFVSRGGDYLGKTGWIVRQGFKSVSYFICTSTRQADILKNCGIKSSKIFKIHNGVENLRVSEYSFNIEQPVQLAVVGYINSEKNQKLIIEALNLLKNDSNFDFKLNVYGTSTNSKYYEELLDLIKSYQLCEQVIFHGFTKDKKKIYTNTDILISSSVSEGFGRTVAEAMAFGIPCVGLYESGGLLDIITNSIDGFLIKNDKKELSKTILKICSNENLRNLISQNALLTFQNKFNEKIMVKRYKKFLNEL